MKYAKIEVRKDTTYSRLYFIAGINDVPRLTKLCTSVLTDPLVETYRYTWDTFDDVRSAREIVYRPGVTDREATEVVLASKKLGLGDIEVVTGYRTYNLNVFNKLYSSIVQRYGIGNVEPEFAPNLATSKLVIEYNIAAMNEQELEELSAIRQLALTVQEMLAIKDYYLEVNRYATDIELETLAQTWSEHCSHKTFKAAITTETDVIHGLLKSLIMRTAQDYTGNLELISLFTDNAGIFRVGDLDVSFKVETHNHPSAIEPFGGAGTGIGGVIRDILGVSGEPVALTNILCFGTGDGIIPLENLKEGVISGIGDYGNKMGIPNVNGAIIYDAGYNMNPLVYCGCLGISPAGSHVKRPIINDRLVVIGGGTGLDGLKGATFSSSALDSHSLENIVSVQIGDPITERNLLEVIIAARDAKLYNAITDCGAGGLSSAICEMVRPYGALIRLDNVHLKYPGLNAWEIWLSEAQERMVLSIPSDNLAKFYELCDQWEVHHDIIGVVTQSKNIQVVHRGKTVMDFPTRLLFDEQPISNLASTYTPKTHKGADNYEGIDLVDVYWGLIRDACIRSKETVITTYDHEVLGRTVVRPGIADAAVIKLPSTSTGLAIGCGINPFYGKHDPYRMAGCIVDEAIRNVVAVGGDPKQLALLDNFCWGNPHDPETLGTLVQAVKGCYHAARVYDVPFISGKDSLNNEYMAKDGQRKAIPGTLLISAVAVVPDINYAITTAIKHPGNLIFLVGGPALPELAGSAFERVVGCSYQHVPTLNMNSLNTACELHTAIKTGIVLACHDIGEGGMAVAASEMAIAGSCGVTITLNNIPGNNDLVKTFSESNGRWLVEVNASSGIKFEEIVKTARLCGHVNGRGVIEIDSIKTTMEEAKHIWTGQE